MTALPTKIESRQQIELVFDPAREWTERVTHYIQTGAPNYYSLPGGLPLSRCSTIEVVENGAGGLVLRVTVTPTAGARVVVERPFPHTSPQDGWKRTARAAILAARKRAETEDAS